MRGLGIVLLAAGVLAGLWFATLRVSAVECEACMQHEGRSTCGTARAATTEDAERTAIATACAALTQGVTATLRCQRSVPLSLACSPP